MNKSLGFDISRIQPVRSRLGDGAFETFANTRAGFSEPRRWIGKGMPEGAQSGTNTNIRNY